MKFLAGVVILFCCSSAFSAELVCYNSTCETLYDFIVDAKHSENVPYGDSCFKGIVEEAMELVFDLSYGYDADITLDGVAEEDVVKKVNNDQFEVKVYEPNWDEFTTHIIPRCS